MRTRQELAEGLTRTLNALRDRCIVAESALDLICAYKTKCVYDKMVAIIYHCHGRVLDVHGHTEVVL